MRVIRGSAFSAARSAQINDESNAHTLPCVVPRPHTQAGDWGPRSRQVYEQRNSAEGFHDAWSGVASDSSRDEEKRRLSATSQPSHLQPPCRRISDGEYYERVIQDGSDESLPVITTIAIDPQASEAPASPHYSRLASSRPKFGLIPVSTHDEDRQTGGECRGHTESPEANCVTRLLLDRCRRLTTCSHTNADPVCAIGRRNDYLKSVADKRSDPLRPHENSAT